MRRQRWIYPVVILLSILAGIAIAGFPQGSSDVKLRPLVITQPVPTTTATVPSPSPSSPGTDSLGDSGPAPTTATSSTTR